MVKKIILVPVLLLFFLFVGEAQAIEVDYWYIIEVHTHNGEIVETVISDEVYKSYDEAFSNRPDGFSKKEVVFVPPRNLRRYWLREKRDSGGRWLNTGRSRGPFDTLSKARNDNPGAREVIGTRYYIRELYNNFRLSYITATGNEEGPFSSNSAARNRANELGVRQAY